MHTRTYTPRVGYEWDDEKAASNFRKHGVDFADAALVFEDELALTMRDLYSDREERFVTIGRYTWREDRIRLISARETTSKER